VVTPMDADTSATALQHPQEAYIAAPQLKSPAVGVEIDDGLALFLINDDLQIYSQNRPARRLVCEGVVHGDRFMTSSTIFNARLQGWIRCRKRRGEDPELRLALRPIGRQTLHASITVLSSPSPELKNLISVVIMDHSKMLSHNISSLKRLCGLTPSEAVILQLLCEGNDAVAISRKLGIAKTTARSHLQRLFAKTGTTRQLELVHLAFNFAPEIEFRNR